MASEINVRELKRRLKSEVHSGSDLRAFVIPGAIPGYDATPLHYVARKGHVDAMDALLNHMDSLKHSGTLGRNERNNLNLAKFVDVNGRTPLHYAVEHAKSGRPSAIQTLLKFDPSLASKVNSAGYTALHRAAHHGRTSAARALLKHDSSLARVKSPNGRTPLHLAASEGHVGVTRVFMDHDASLARDRNGAYQATPLHYAAHYGRAAVVKELMKRNQSLARLANSINATPLHHAAAMGYDGVIYAMMDHDPSLAQLETSSGMTPLHQAAVNGRAGAIYALTRLRYSHPNSYVDHLDGDRYAALHYAAKAGHSNAVKSLMAAGANVNVLSGHGQSPMYLAARHGQADAIRELARAGAKMHDVGPVGHGFTVPEAIRQHAPNVLAFPSNIRQAHRPLNPGTELENALTYEPLGNKPAYFIRTPHNTSANVSYLYSEGTVRKLLDTNARDPFTRRSFYPRNVHRLAPEKKRPYFNSNGDYDPHGHPPAKHHRA